MDALRIDKETIMDIHELRKTDPHRFELEYQQWVEHDFHYEWWDTMYEDFKKDMAKVGMWVNDKSFSLSYCQSDYAAFEGRLDMATWMRDQGYDEKYLPLVLDFEEYGAKAKVSIAMRGGYSYCADIDYCAGNTYPPGIFADMPYDDWTTLCVEMLDAEPWEEHVDKWLRDQCEELYNRLQEEYEYLSSEESFINACDANDIQFEEIDD